MSVICNCGRPTSGAWLCDHCQNTLKWALVNVGVYTDDLETVARKQVRYGGNATKGSIGKAQPLILDGRFTGRLDHGSQLRSDSRATVVAWCRTVMEDQPQVHGPACPSCIHVSCATVKRRRWPSDTVGSMVRYLARQFRWIVLERWVPDLLDEMLDLERRLAWFVDRPADRWYAGKCSATDETGNMCPVELYAVTEKGTITCPGCGVEYDVGTRRDFLLREAKDYHVTATEAAAALLAWTDYDGTETKLVDRIRKWRDREKLTVADVTSLYGRDRHLYRLGDIQDLLIGDAQNAQGKHVRDKGAA